MPDALDLTCPCEDGLPDPCTVCGMGAADGACQLDRVNAERHSDAYTRGVSDGRRAYRTQVEALIMIKTPSAERCSKAPLETGRSMQTLRWTLQEILSSLPKVDER